MKNGLARACFVATLGLAIPIITSAAVIPTWCADTGQCLKTWQFNSIANGAYLDTGASNSPPGSGPYVAGVAFDQGSAGGPNVFRNYFAFDIDESVFANANPGDDDRLIAQIAIRGGPDTWLNINQRSRLRLFDPNAGDKNGPEQTILMNSLISGNGGIDMFARLGGDTPGSGRDYGFNGLGNTEFLADPSWIDLDIDLIADVIGAHNFGENRLAIGGRLETLDRFGNWVEIRADSVASDTGIFFGTGAGLCPTCGATLHIARIDRSVNFPGTVPEPGTLVLLGLGLAVLAALSRRRNAIGILTVPALIAISLVTPAGAVPLTLTNQELRLQIDNGSTQFLSDDAAPLSGGAFNGFHTSVWYRIGATGGEAGLGSLRLLSQMPSDFGNDGTIESVLYRFEDVGERFFLNVRYTIVGRDADGVASIQEEIGLANRTAAALDLHLFFSSYIDLDVPPGLPSEFPLDEDDVTRISTTGMRQTSKHGSRLETFLLSDVAPDQFVVTMRPVRIPPAPTVDYLGDALRDSFPTDLATLSGNPNPFYGDQWAWQWDATIAADRGFGAVLRHRFSNASVVPEPNTFALLGFGVACIAAARRRKR